MENPPPEFAGLSKNKIKKKLRNPYKNYDKTPGREIFEKCIQCTNPRVRDNFCKVAMCVI